MSSYAYADDGVALRTSPRPLLALLSRRGSDVLLGIGVIALATALLAYLATAYNVDSWLALVAGRAVWTHGIPHRETLTALSYGTAWHDQQWLSELASYAIYRLGGFGLLGIVNVALLTGGVAGAIAAARRLGARPAAVMVALPVCLWLIIPSREVRTQEFAIPLFVATIWLLASDSRSPSRRVYWCLPILVLWANLHGTVTLGAALVALRALTLLWERRSRLLHDARAWRRPVALLIGAPLALLITPYGTGILPYYRTMFLESSVRHVVSEWQPITSQWITAIPFFLAAAVAIWSFGRDASRTTPWERLALLALAAGSIEVVRNVLFFSLCALVVVPVSLGVGRGSGLRPADPRRGRINLVLLGASLAALSIAVLATMLRPASQLEYSYQRAGVLSAVQAATKADPSLKLYSDVRFSDWLLWRDPGLAGRVAGDARFELLTPAQTGRLVALTEAAGLDWKRAARGFRLIVLDRRYAPAAASGFAHEPGATMLYDDGARLVVLRTSREAG
jgi:hypothetical protein